MFSYFKKLVGSRKENNRFFLCLKATLPFTVLQWLNLFASKNTVHTVFNAPFLAF